MDSTEMEIKQAEDLRKQLEAKTKTIQESHEAGERNIMIHNIKSQFEHALENYKNEWRAARGAPVAIDKTLRVYDENGYGYHQITLKYSPIND